MPDMRKAISLKIWLLSSLLLLAACQGTPARTGFFGSPLLPGDEVEILRELVVPAGLARVYLQSGKTTGYGGTNQYVPFCYFLLRDPLPAEQRISPGVLVVEKVWLDQTTVSLDLPSRLASALSFGWGNQSPIAWQFHVVLSAADRPRITLVASGAFDGPATAAPIRLAELREALGSYAEVRVGATPKAQ